MENGLAVSPSVTTYEIIDPRTLASRWCVPESWVREYVRTRTQDPIPHIRFGKYCRFKWGSPELEEWLQRRMIGPNNSKVRRGRSKETIQ